MLAVAAAVLWLSNDSVRDESHGATPQADRVADSGNGAEAVGAAPARALGKQPMAKPPVTRVGAGLSASWKPEEELNPDEKDWRDRYFAFVDANDVDDATQAKLMRVFADVQVAAEMDGRAAADWILDDNAKFVRLQRAAKSGDPEAVREYQSMQAEIQEAGRAHFQSVQEEAWRRLAEILSEKQLVTFQAELSLDNLFLLRPFAKDAL
jgi:hypothetical protein